MRTLFGFFLAALSVTGFAATFVFGGALTKECGVAPEELSFLRFAIAGGTMLAVGRQLHRQGDPREVVQQSVRRLPPRRLRRRDRRGVRRLRKLLTPFPKPGPSA